MGALGFILADRLEEMRLAWDGPVPGGADHRLQLGQQGDLAEQLVERADGDAALMDLVDRRLGPGAWPLAIGPVEGLPRRIDQRRPALDVRHHVRPVPRRRMVGRDHRLVLAAVRQGFERLFQGGPGGLELGWRQGRGGQATYLAKQFGRTRTGRVQALRPLEPDAARVHCGRRR